MGTRSIIMAFDGQQVIRFYRRMDGDPTSVLGELKDLFKSCKINSSEDLKNNIEGIAEVDDSCDKAIFKSKVIKKNHWGNQGDLEWIYVLDITSKSIDIYGGGYKNILPIKHVQNGTVNPEIYAEALYEEYQEKEIKDIREQVKKLGELGWGINSPRSIKYIKKLVVA